MAKKPMADTPIGEPIPVGDLPSLTTDIPPVLTDNLEVPTESKVESSALGEATLPVADLSALPALVEDVEPPVSEPDLVPMSGWLDLVQTTWKLALMPAVTWSSYLTASWKAWENAFGPGQRTT